MLWLHITIPEGAVKYSNTVRKLQGASSTDLMAPGKLFSGVRWSLIHNSLSPEGVIFPITAKEIGNQTLGEHCRVDKLKCDYWTSIRQHLLHSVHHKWVLEQRERESDPEIMISLTLKTFSSKISRVCFSYPFAKLCSWAASKTQGWISTWHKSLQLSVATWAKLIQGKQTPPGKAEQPGESGALPVTWLCRWPGDRTRPLGSAGLWEKPSKAAACFGQGNCFLCMAHWAFVFDEQIMLWGSVWEWAQPWHQDSGAAEGAHPLLQKHWPASTALLGFHSWVLRAAQTWLHSVWADLSPSLAAGDETRGKHFIKYRTAMNC